MIGQSFCSRQEGVSQPVRPGLDRQEVSGPCLDRQEVSGPCLDRQVLGPCLDRQVLGSCLDRHVGSLP